MKLSTQRVGLWDQYGGSMPSGHTRWLLEQFEFPFNVIFPPELDAGNLRQKYDVIVFVTGAIPAANPSAGGGFGGRGGGGGGGGANIPAEFQNQLGSVTADKTVPQLKRFMEEGGTVITIGSSTNLAGHLGLPVADYMVERAPNGTERSLPQDKFYVPGSVMRVAVDNTQPITAGMPKYVDVFFDDSPVFRLEPDAAAKGVKPLAWFDNAVTAAQRLGVGPELPAGWHGDGAGGCRHRQAVPVRSRNPVPWAAGRHVQAAVQRDLLRPGREDESSGAVEGCKGARVKGCDSSHPFALCAPEIGSDPNCVDDNWLFKPARRRNWALTPISLSYQIVVRCARTIGSPALHPNALANSGMFDSGPFTRNSPGECTPVWT